MAFPAIAQTAKTNGTAGTGTPSVSIPVTGVAAGHLIILSIRADAGTSITWPSGWTELFQSTADASDDIMGVAYRKCTGSETSPITVTVAGGAKFASVAWRITGAADAAVRAPEIGTTATGTSANPNSPAVTPTGGAKDYLWLALGSCEGIQTNPVTYPTNYSLNQLTSDSGSGGALTSNVKSFGAARQLNASSEDPGQFTISASDDWTAQTVVVHPPEYTGTGPFWGIGLPLSGQGASNAEMRDAAPADFTASVNNYPSNTTATKLFVPTSPGSNTAYTPGTGQDKGWNFAATNFDGRPTTPVNRLLPAGTVVTFTATMQASQTGSSGSVGMSVYKRSAAGALTSLGSKLSASQTFVTTNVDVTFSDTVTIASDVLFAAGETLHFEFYSTCTSNVALATDFLLGGGNARLKVALSVTAGLRYNWPRSPADTAAATDTLARSTVLTRGPADVATATDVLVRGVIVARGLADTAVANDALTRTIVALRVVAETATATDVVARAAILARSLTDAASAVDVTARLIVTARALSDSAPAADTLARTITLPRSVADSAPATDVLVRAVIVSRATSDSAPAADAATRSAGLFARTLSDSAPATDAVARKIVGARAVSDSAPTTDALVRLAVFGRFVVGTAPATDALTRSTISARSLVDSAPATDSVVRTFNYERFLTDNIGPSGGGATRRVLVLVDD